MQVDLTQYRKYEIPLLQLLSAIVLLVYFYDLFALGENASLRIHDFLDSIFGLMLLLVKSGAMFADSDTVIPEVLGGLPRFSLAGEYNFNLLLLSQFSPFTAFVINEIIMHLTAFIGMLLLSRHFIISTDTPNKNLINYAVALMFSLLPFWPAGGLSIAGQPLAFFAFLKIKEQSDTFVHWLIIIFIPFYSSFVLSFFFVLTVLSFWVLYDAIAHRTLHLRLLAAIFLMTILYLGIEYRLVFSMLMNHDFVSHRTAFAMMHDELLTAYRNAHFMLLDGHINMQNMQFLYILPLLTISLIAFAFDLKRPFNVIFSLLFYVSFFTASFTGLWSQLLTLKYFPAGIFFLLLYMTYIRKGAFYFLFLLIVVTAFLYGFWSTQAFAGLAEQFSIIKSFNFSRFYFLHSLLWFVLAGLALEKLSRMFRLFPLFLLVFLIAQINYTFIIRNFDYPQRDKISFHQFFDPKLFKALQEYIGKAPKSYRVGSVGLHPSITLFNGFSTIDGYLSNYPLKYKQRFRRAIIGELNKNENIRRSFDEWGNACYLFSAEIGVNVGYNHDTVIHDLDLNITALRDLNASYILSAYPISNAHGLNFEKTFIRPESYWTIYLYRIPE